MSSNLIFKVWLAALPLTLLISCTSQSTPTAQDKKAELCTNLARFDTAVATLKSMSPSSTVGDFRTARDQVATTFKDVQASSQGVQAAKSAELEQAYQALNTAMQAVPNTATLNQAATSLAPLVAAVDTAENQVKAGLNCP